MSRNYLSCRFAVPLAASLLACLGLAPAVRAQDFPDPLKNDPVPVESETEVFRNLGRNGYGKRPPNPFRLTLSTYSMDSRTIDRGIGNLVSFDVEYDAFTSRLIGGPTVIGFFADLSSGDGYKRSESANFEASVVGFGVIARRVFTESLNRGHFYVGAGAGYYTARLDIDPIGPQRYQETDGSFGVRFQGGYQFTKNFYAQFDLLSLDPIRTRNANGRSLRIDPSGARLGVGYQF